MNAKGIVSACVAGVIAATPAAASDGLVGGIVGGVIGGIIVNEATKNRQQRQHVRTVPRSTVSTAQRQANREMQVALNHFGFGAGTPDGAIGPRSRAAVSQYQAVLGHPPTGYITEYERMILTTAYQRALIGGPGVSQVMASHPMGMRGLLVVQRDEMAGVPVQPFAAPAAPVPAPAPEPALSSVPVVAEPAPAPEPESPSLPSFMGQGAVTASLASHCNKVSLLTNSNGGFVTVSNMTDPAFALSEQFCLARTYAISQGEDLMAKVPGFTPQQIAQQCEGFGPVLRDHVAALSLKDRDAVLQEVSGFVLQSGMAPAQLSGTGRICLGVGYVTDNMDVAIGSALVLTVLGERGYAELVGHHLVQGFGTSERPDLALPWYEMSLEAAGDGATMVFAPGMADRADLIRRAAYTLGGKPDQAQLVPVVPASLPAFALAPATAPAPEVAAEAELPGFDLPTETAPGETLVMAPAATAPAQTETRSGIEALPFAARLPFMLFRQ